MNTKSSIRRIGLTVARVKNLPISRRKFEQTKLSEHDSIVKSVAEDYESQRFVVFAGKKIGRFTPDIVAIKNQSLTIAVEAKPNDANELRKGVGQCISYMDWVHKVFLATSPGGIQLSSQLLRGTPIGLLATMDDKVTTVKEAERREPDHLKSIRLLSSTVGFCWICGRSFNVVQRTQRGRGEIFIAHRDIEPILFKAMEQTLGKKIRTKGSWVAVCTVCSRIIGEAIHEYLTRLLKGEEYPIFDFDKLSLKEDRKLLAELTERKR